MNGVISRNQEALKKLYEKYEQLLYRVISSSIKKEEQIEEVIACVYKKIWADPSLLIKEKHVSVKLIKMCEEVKTLNESTRKKLCS